MIRKRRCPVCRKRMKLVTGYNKNLLWKCSRCARKGRTVVHWPLDFREK
jgi:tRNA(Ile2) C34 agmatinyltransferase TiaS